MANMYALALKIWLVGVCITWCGLRECEASSVPAVLFFGDSYGDPGNNDFISTMIRSNFPPYGKNFPGQKPTGRFSDGKIMPDYIVVGLGIKELLPAYLDPNITHQDLLTGVSFSSSGSGLDNLTAITLAVIPVWQQIKYLEDYRTRISALIGQENATILLNRALSFISIGTNDFIANYFLQINRRLEYNVAQFQDFLVKIYSNYIEDLYKIDLRKIAIINVPPLGSLPLERTISSVTNGDSVKDMNDAAMGFNSKLESMISGLKTKLPGLQIVYLDYYALVKDFITSPKQYGFTVATKSCCGTGTYEFGIACNYLTAACTNDSDYVFFDSIHLTQKAYSIISQHFLRHGIKDLL
ncbi:hypothetical protein SUGI_0760490 [Cryptomeria japonica]|uniref:GDSL esterase/lipase At2g42990 n=1 Tax=Cryptomeria japonica TaxID=3369 RepID=UPI00241472A3|nr:GDSL esterase/lipase At2g42990 [Cryptomeria japonica]GLJ37430.1 hypothetical protein SUGI_0760490 [Cryptomeria japonica]